MKILAGFTVICGCILSNTYKTDNMYEMTLLKQFQPLTTFKELLNSKYNVYSFPSLTNINTYDEHFLNSRIARFGKPLTYVLAGNTSILFFTSQFLVTNYEFYLVRPKLFQYAYNNSGIWSRPLYKIEQILRNISLPESFTFYWEEIEFTLNKKLYRKLTY